MDAPSRLQLLKGLDEKSGGDEFRIPDARFEAHQLHDRSPFCWAVLGLPSGAIATGASGELLMRMRRHDAERFAKDLTERAAQAATEH